MRADASEGQDKINGDEIAQMIKIVSYKPL